MDMTTDTKYYLAVDIGASSGRHILSHMEDGKLVLEEVYRFQNNYSIKDEHKIWDTERLFGEILEGMKQCKKLCKVPASMGIDTWAVDYVLLDKESKKLGSCMAYRDSRTQGMDEKVYSIVPRDELYRRTGIQRAIFNTIFQLMADKTETPEKLEAAETLLMVPDYFHFLLTGVKKQEYTNASSTGLLDAANCDWDRDLIKRLGYPDKLFGDLSMPGTPVGHLTKEIQDIVGFDTEVVLPATHDTGSAVMSVPSQKEDTLYISSGTWSLMGCELKTANTSKEAEEANFTNEGGYDHRFRFLKNIMGLWMIQSVRRELIAMWDKKSDDEKSGQEEPDYSFGSLCDMASKTDIDTVVDAQDDRFLAPDSMITEIKNYAAENGMQVPETPGELAHVVYRSLANCYKDALHEMETITGKTFDTINIVGGGCKAEYLNILTKEATGCTITAGPDEATAIGNLGSQLIKDKVVNSLSEFRQLVFDSFAVKVY